MTSENTNSVTLRIEATPEQIQTLVNEWVNNLDSTLNITPVHAPQDGMTVRVTYVKERD